MVELLPYKQDVVGSIPSQPTYFRGCGGTVDTADLKSAGLCRKGSTPFTPTFSIPRSLAQSVEHGSHKPKVSGSNPGRPTPINSKIKIKCDYLLAWLSSFSYLTRLYTST